MVLLDDGRRLAVAAGEVRRAAVDQQREGEQRDHAQHEQRRHQPPAGHRDSPGSAGSKRRRLSSGRAVAASGRNSTTPSKPCPPLSGIWVTAKPPRNFAIEPAIPLSASGKARASWNAVVTYVARSASAMAKNTAGSSPPPSARVSR